MSSKRIQMTVFILLLLGTASLYYSTFVTINGRIATIESALPPEPVFEPLISKDDDAAELLEKVGQEVALLFDVSVPQVPAIPDALYQIARQAHTAGIRGISMSTNPYRVAEQIVTEVPLFLWPIQVSFQSKYVQLAQFVHALQGIPRLTEVLKISMKRQPPGVSTELSLVVYSQTAPPPEKHKAKRKEHRDTEGGFEADGTVDGIQGSERGGFRETGRSDDMEFNEDVAE